MNIQWNILGNTPIIQYLTRIALNSSPNHAYTFLGQRGIGKTTVALKLAQILLCENKTDIVPCHACQNCKLHLSFSNPDIHIIQRVLDETEKSLKKNISIEQIQMLEEVLSRRSFFNNYKISIISEADTLSDKAANALLKTLEEPYPKTIFILIARHLQYIPKTIASRCQILHFYPVKDDVIFEHLIRQGCERNKAEIITKISGGSPGIAIDRKSVV